MLMKLKSEETVFNILQAQKDPFIAGKSSPHWVNV